MHYSILAIHNNNSTFKSFDTLPNCTITHCTSRLEKDLIDEIAYFSPDILMIDFRYIESAILKSVIDTVAIPVYLYCESKDIKDLPNNTDYLTSETPIHVLEKRIQNALKKDTEESHQNFNKLQMLTAGSVFGFWEWNMESKTIFFDDSACKILALDDDCNAINEKEILERINKKDKPFLDHLFTTYIKENDSFSNVEFRIEDFKGSNKWILSSGNIVHRPNGSTVSKMIGFIQDISSRKKVEKELRESEEKFRMIFETGSDGLFLVDIASDKILELNEAAAKLFSSKSEILLHSSFSSLWEDPDFIKAAIKNQHLRVYSEFGKRHNSVIFPTDATFSYFMLNNALTLIASVRDVTERFESEKEIIRAKEKAEESDRLKSAFLANMSHEIRTPLNSIVGFSRLLIRKSYSAEKQKVMMNEIQTNSDQLLNIINDILDISKIESNQLDIDIYKVSSRAILTELYEPFKLQIETHRKSIDLILDTDKKSDAIVFADPLRVKQVLSNLLNNAIKFTNEGYVKYGYFLDEKQNPIFFVEDTGKGIARKNLSIIFEHFRQEEDSYTRRYGGTGLGLSISKSLVELMGGSIWVDSDKGKGARFFFTLPIKEAINNHPYSNNETSENETVNISNKRILFVDDVENSYLVATEIFEGYNIDIVYVNDGNKAINILKHDSNFHLILMDIQMPGLNGVDATKKIKEILPHIPIIAQTAYALKGDEEKFLSKGLDAYITKPIDMDKLLKLVMQHIL